MKQILTFVFLCGLILNVSAQDAPKKVLFIGNSYTEVNDLPQLVRLAAASAGDEMTYESNTPGGCTFQQHCENQSMNLIRQGGWDVVVLQEQSQLPSFPQSQVERECLPYAARLVEAVYANNPQGEAMFYMTWGRKYGDSQNAQYFPVLGSYEGMDSMLYTRYMYMARANDASVCPVGRVWRYLRRNHEDIELYQSDNSHPSLAGSYAGACAFYTMIFHKSPECIRYVPDSLDTRQANIIRQAVQCVVYDSLSFWLRQSDTTHTDTTHTDTTHTLIPSVVDDFSCRIFPNPATSPVTISLPPESLPGQAAIYDVKGCLRQTLLLCQPDECADVSSLPSGIYTLHVTTKSRTLTSRLMKR